MTLEGLPGAFAENAAADDESSDWQAIAPGLEWRELRPENDELRQLKILRVDPQVYSFRALYSPAKPYSLAQWRSLAPDAVAIVNASFFDPSYLALGLVISDSEAHGAPYLERGGAFLVEKDRVEVRANRRTPYRADEAAEQAVQGFPLLVEEGEQAYFAQRNDRRARRTAIAQDSAGRILLISAPVLGPTLGELSAFLAESDLDIETAFNLDGGGSTMMAVRDMDYFQPAFEAVPVILTVAKR